LALAIWWIVVGPGLTDWLSLDAEQWTNLEALSTAFAFAFGSIAALLVLLELLETADSRNLTIYQDIYEKFMHPDQIAARRFIYNDLWKKGQYDGDFAVLERMTLEDLKKDFSSLFKKVEDTSDAQGHIKTVLNAIDYFFLVDQD
jgi:predicted GNAT superfamily acetyltransferase